MSRETLEMVQRWIFLLAVVAILVFAAMAAITETRMADRCKASGGAWTSPGGCVQPHPTR